MQPYRDDLQHAQASRTDLPQEYYDAVSTLHSVGKYSDPRTAALAPPQHAVPLRSLHPGYSPGNVVHLTIRSRSNEYTELVFWREWQPVVRETPQQQPQKMARTCPLPPSAHLCLQVVHVQIIGGVLVLAALIAIGVGLGVGLSNNKKSSGSGSGSGSSSSDSTSSSTPKGGPKQTDPNDPSTFVRDSNLHQSLYGLAYTPEGSQLPDCGNSLGGSHCVIFVSIWVSLTFVIDSECYQGCSGTKSFFFIIIKTIIDGVLVVDVTTDDRAIIPP